MLHVICTGLLPGHLSVRVGDSSRRSKEIVKISTCAFQCDHCYYDHHLLVTKQLTSLCLFVYLSVCLPICLSSGSPVLPCGLSPRNSISLWSSYLPVCLSVGLSVCQSVCLSVSRSIYLYICQSSGHQRSFVVFLPETPPCSKTSYISVCLSVYLSVCL